VESGVDGCGFFLAKRGHDDGVDFRSFFRRRWAASEAASPRTLPLHATRGFGHFAQLLLAEGFADALPHSATVLLAAPTFVLLSALMERGVDFVGFLLAIFGHERRVNFRSFFLRGLAAPERSSSSSSALSTFSSSSFSSSTLSSSSTRSTPQSAAKQRFIIFVKVVIIFFFVVGALPSCSDDGMDGSAHCSRILRFKLRPEDISEGSVFVLFLHGLDEGVGFVPDEFANFRLDLFLDFQRRFALGPIGLRGSPAVATRSAARWTVRSATRSWATSGRGECHGSEAAHQQNNRASLHDGAQWFQPL